MKTHPSVVLPLREKPALIVPPWIVSMLMEGIYEGMFMATTISGCFRGLLFTALLRHIGRSAR